MKTVALVALLGVPAIGHAAQAQRPPAPPAPVAATIQDAKGEAYQQFLLAQRLESARDHEGAVAAFRRAIALDPESAELSAALSDLLLDLNRVDESRTAANRALTIDPANRDAHRVLGTLFAAAATSESREARQARAQNLATAIDHLEQAAAERPGLQADPNVRAMLARLHILNGAYDKAIPLLADLVRQEPGWQEGAGLLVDAYVSAGRTEEAVSWLEQAAEDNPELNGSLGDLYGRIQRWQDAAEAYERALSVSGRSFDLRVRYASMLMNAGGVENILKAREVLRQAVQMRGTDERALYLLSNAERQTHELDAAEATARRLIKQNAKNPRGYYALAEALEQQQRYQEVIDNVSPALPQLRTTENASFALGLLLPHLGFAYTQLGKHDEAITTFQEAQKLAPDDTTVTGFLIQANLSAKRYPQAVELAHAARLAHPDEIRFARLEADALRQSGKVDQGLAVLEELLKKQGDDPDAHLALARAYADANRGGQAVRVLQDAQSRFPKDPDPSFELGAVFEKQKKYSEAETAFKQALQRDPNHAPTLNYLGYMLAERGERLDESVAYIKKALDLEPNNGSYLDSLGWAYYKDGRLDLAEENLKRAAGQLIKNSVVQDHYGDLLFKLGRFEDAIAAWTRALGGDQDDLDRAAVDKKIKSARQKLPKR